MKRKNRNHTAGFSLIEVIVGIAVLGLVTVPVCAGLVLSLRLNESSRDLMAAQLQASAAVETLMAEGIDTENEFTRNADDPEKFSKEVNGAQVTIVSREGGAYYDVSVVSMVGSKTVTIATHIRAKGGVS